MEIKIALMVAEVEARHLTVKAVCEQFQVSRQTYYRLRRRFAAEGPAGLVPRSRRPHSCPAATSSAMVAAVLAARAELAAAGWDEGALSIYYWMVAAGQQPPAARTVHRILVRHGLISPQPKKRRRSSYRRFQFPATDDCWQIDAFEYTLVDGTAVVVFELKDDCSRYLLEVRAWPREDTLGAWTSLAYAIGRYGRPRMLLSDNSLAFTGHRLNKIVLFEQNLIKLGIKPIWSSANHPQTCGKTERGHQTAQQWLRRQPTATTLDELQSLLNHYRTAFNQRPHQALNGATPLTARVARRRTEPLPRPVIDYPAIVTTPTANRNGAIRVAGAVIALGREYAGQPMIVFNTNDHLLVFYRHHLARELTIDRDRTYQPLRPIDNTRNLSHRRQTREPSLTPPGSSTTSPPSRSAAAVKMELPTGRTTLTAASTGHNQHRRNPVSPMSCP
jgi:Helix-turn-helix domain/Integrase core domain